MWLDKSCLQYFGSTAAPSILSFYPALGVKRDVRSEPELSNYALRGLLSVEYLITTPEKQDRLSTPQPTTAGNYAFAKDGFMRSTADTKLRAHGLYLRLLHHRRRSTRRRPRHTRANLLMRALVLSDEDAAVYGKYLKKLPEGRSGTTCGMTPTSQDCRRPPRLGCQRVPDDQLRLPRRDHAGEGEPRLLLRALRRRLHGLRQRAGGRHCRRWTRD